MSEKSVSEMVETIETTVGELIEIITEIALEVGKSEAEGYALASATLEHMSRRHLGEAVASE